MQDADYQMVIKKMIADIIINSYANAGKIEEGANVLDRIFRHKQKVINNLAVYLKNDVENKGVKIEESLDELSFFVSVLNQYVDKNIGQPINK